MQKVDFQKVRKFAQIMIEYSRTNLSALHYETDNFEAFMDLMSKKSSFAHLAHKQFKELREKQEAQED